MSTGSEGVAQSTPPLEGRWLFVVQADGFAEESRNVDWRKVDWRRDAQEVAVQLSVVALREQTLVTSGSRVEELQQDSPMKVEAVTRQAMVSTGYERLTDCLRLTGEPVWEQLPAGPPAQGLNLAVHKGKVYRVGGMQPQNKKGDPTDNLSLSGVARFDPATKQWEALAPRPEPRSSHDIVLIGDQPRTTARIPI